MSVWMLWDVIWTCFFTKPVHWQNSYVILEKSYLSHMSLFSMEIWQVDRSSSKKSKTIEFASNGFLQLKIFKLEWSKVNISRMQGLTLKTVISMLFFFLAIYVYKGMGVSFLMTLETFRFDLQSSSFAQNIDRSQICQLSSIYFFLNLTSKSAFKT